MKGIKIGLLAQFILIAILACYVVMIKNEKPKIAYIELNKVFMDFQMKKELEANLKSAQEKRQRLLDSLKFELQILSKTIEAEGGKDKVKLTTFAVKRDAFLEKEHEFEQDNSNTAKAFDDQIFTQLNQYVKDYGMKNDYLAIFGAEGSGTLMYAKEALNITQDVKNYINDRYKGKK